MKVTINAEPRVTLEIGADMANVIRSLLYATSWAEDKNEFARDVESLAGSLDGVLGEVDLLEEIVVSGDAGMGELSVERG